MTTHDITKATFTVAPTYKGASGKLHIVDPEHVDVATRSLCGGYAEGKQMQAQYGDDQLCWHCMRAARSKWVATPPPVDVPEECSPSDDLGAPTGD